MNTTDIINGTCHFLVAEDSPPHCPLVSTPKIYSEAPDISKGQPVASDLGIGEENLGAIISY